jgi:DNA-binding NarL/FixJ family response regulator
MDIKRVLVVEDERMFREFLVDWLRGEGFEVREAASLAEAGESGGEDLVILDMELPDGEGMGYVERETSRNPGLRILVLTAHVGSYPVMKLKRSGVMGVLDKGEASGEELRRALSSIRDWRTYYSQGVERTFRQLIAESTAYYKRLSPREEEMLKLFGLGYSNEAIAQERGLSVATVQGHRRNVMAKVGVNTSPELIIWAIRNGFVNDTRIERERRETA